MRTVSTHCEKMLCKISRSEVHSAWAVWQWDTDRHRAGVLSMCVFLYTRVFYHCPTTSVAPRLKNTCRPGRKFFHFQNQDRPCVGHATVRATLDAVHRVTVLCHIAMLCPCCATVSYRAVLMPCCVYYAVLSMCCVYSPCRRLGLVKEVHGRIKARRGPLTNRYHAGRPNQKPSVLACGTPYQPLPDSVLAERNPLGDLAWSRSPYQLLPHCRSGCRPI